MAKKSALPQDTKFDADLFAFLRALAAHNDRAWFKARQARYEASVREPARAFLRAIAAKLEKSISPYFVADDRKVGGSLFRIQRDVRFSKDKSPYKTHTGLQIRHEEAEDAHAPGFYLHLDPKEVFVGVGLWRPPTAVARQLRQAIADNAKTWKRVTQGKRFGDRFALVGESLKRTPKPWDDDHPLATDLRRKDFLALAPLQIDEVLSPDFQQHFIEDLRRATPFMRFLCEALKLPF